MPTFPKSSAVSVGADATATQYNNLRLDAIYVGVHFGDESDGAKSVTADATLDPAGEFEYSSLTVDATKTLGLVTTTNIPLIIKTTGDVTINGKIDVDGDGAAGGAGGSGGGGVGSSGDSGSSGTAGAGRITGYGSVSGGSGGAGARDAQSADDGGGGGGGGSMFNAGVDGSNGTGVRLGGSGGAKMATWSPEIAFLIQINRFIFASGGGGGGGEESGLDGGEDGSAGSAGAGSCFIFVGGDLTFGASSTLTAIGVAGAASAGSGGGAGGGGGGGTFIFIVAGDVTDNGVTTTVTGGAGGTAAGGGGAGGAGAAGDVIIFSMRTGVYVSP